ncbi:MAG TPA: ricin-type beta-trefoil lectin domain protein [Kribbella sp.]|nr:ricin-type beta-trefoil lectin domain protein [Kribbella sp.]
MRSPRVPGSSRFADTFARRPGVPRITRLPDRRAWSTTAVVATLVAGIAIGTSVIARGGSDPSYTADVAFATPDHPTVTLTPEPTPGATQTMTVKPGAVVKTAVMPGVTVTLPPSTVTGSPPLAAKPPRTTVTASTTTTAKATTTARTTATLAPNPPAKPGAPRVATSNGPRQPPPAAGPGAVPLQNYGSNRCIDVQNATDGIGRDGTPLQLWDCASRANQEWTFQPDGTVRSMGLCMDLAWASTADGTQVQLVNCNGGWAQKFALNNSHDLVNPTADKCVTADATANGGRLTLRSCSGASNQKWHKL